MSDNIFDLYREFTSITECPKIFHRWAVISGIATVVGRNVWIPHGHAKIFPNKYIMFIGSPGSRKTTAISIVRKIVRDSGFINIAAERTSKEKFLEDLDEQNSKQDSTDPFTANLFGGEEVSESDITAMYIAADEFNDFIGFGNISFISILGSLWDYSGIYTGRIKHGKSVSIPNPTINILGGNTPTNFQLAFPAEVLGQGFFSRLVLVYGETTGVKLAFPPEPPELIRSKLVQAFTELQSLSGELKIHSEARQMLEEIYVSWKPILDPRYENYSTRRFTHLLKLCIICAVARTRTSLILIPDDVRLANSILTYAEFLMPKAMGEFGKAKNADVSHKILEALDATRVPLSIDDLWKLVHKDLDRFDDLQEILVKLKRAEKIQAVGGRLLPKKTVLDVTKCKHVDLSLLDPEEMQYEYK